MGLSSSTPSVDIVERALVQNARDKLQSAPFFNFLSNLKFTLKGEVLTPDLRTEYNTARRRPFNHDARGFPLLIIRVNDAEDVAAAVTFFKSRCGGYKLCVLGGGHSNSCMLTDSIVLDLMNLSSTHVDLEAGLASVGGGAYLKSLDDALAPYGLGTPVGTFPLTGVGGLVLGGGRGWLSRLYGFSVDNLVQIEVVTADGRILTAADDNEYADLIMGCRGGGGNFGVVTQFTFRVHSLPPISLGGYNTFLTPNITSMVQTSMNFDGLMQECDKSTSAALVLGRPHSILTIWTHFGSEHSVAEVPILARASQLGGWLTTESSVRPMSYHSGIQNLTRQHNVSGNLYNTLVQIGSISEQLPRSFFEELLAHTSRSKPRSLGRCEVSLFVVGGNARANDASARTCVDRISRESRYFAIVDAEWHATAGDLGREDAKAWAKASVKILMKYSTQHTLHAPDAVGALLSEVEEAKLEDSLLRRLKGIKAKYDPDNIFCQNMNIKPLVTLN